MPIVRRACPDRLRTRSSTPQLRRISIVRGRSPVALGKIDRPGCFSTTRTRTPVRAMAVAVVRPAGPAPTTRTSYEVAKSVDVMMRLLEGQAQAMRAIANDRPSAAAADRWLLRIQPVTPQLHAPTSLRTSPQTTVASDDPATVFAHRSTDN